MLRVRPRHWTEKPTSPIHIDWGHPLMLGLVHCVLFNNDGARPIDLANGLPAAVTGSPTWHARGVNVTGGAGYDVRSPPQTRSICTTGLYASQCSIRIIHTPTTWAGTYTTMLSRVTGGVKEVRLYVNTSGNIQFFSALNGDIDGVAIATAMTTGREWDFVATLSGTTLTGYVNGIAKGTKVVSVGSSTATDNILLGHDGSNSNYDGVWSLFQFWTRCLLPVEVRELALNPYAGLRVPRLSRWAVKTAAAGTAKPWHYYAQMRAV